MFRKVFLLALVAAILGTLVYSTTSSAGAYSFTHGLAARAGHNFAHLWARANVPDDAYKLRISKKKNLTGARTINNLVADLDHDNTIKVLVKKLDPNTRYYYRFFGPSDSQSVLGTFRTFPRRNRAKPLKLAISGDSDELWTDWPKPQTRPFEVLDRVREERPNIFIYMGDTIYSDSETGAPLAETVEEKWAKYKNNRALPASLDALRKLNTWAVWDDHEVVNDFDGAELKVSDPDLFNAGVQAFNDYWPVVEKRYYRKVDYGKHIDMIFLDERSYRTESADKEGAPCNPTDGPLDFAPKLPQEHRTTFGLPPVDPECLADLKDPNRTMLGTKQLSWFKERLKKSNAKWKLVINEVPLTELFVRPYDRWDGYEHERDNILNFIKRQKIKNVVWLTTDLHANGGLRVYKEILNENSKPITYEMIAGPIQTCDLDCEVDDILGAESGGELLHGLLVNEGLVDADCVNIDTYAYGLVTTDKQPTKLSLRWRSNQAAKGPGGTPVGNCPMAQLPKDYN